MTCGLVHASYSLPEWQAVKLTFFAPCAVISVQSLLLVYFSVPTSYFSRYNSFPLYPATNLPNPGKVFSIIENYCLLVGTHIYSFVSGDKWKAIGLLRLVTVKCNPLQIKFVLLGSSFNFIDEVKEVRGGQRAEEGGGDWCLDLYYRGLGMRQDPTDQLPLYSNSLPCSNNKYKTFIM